MCLVNEIAAFFGARKLVYPEICRACCAPCALHFISQNTLISGSINAMTRQCLPKGKRVGRRE